MIVYLENPNKSTDKLLELNKIKWIYWKSLDTKSIYKNQFYSSVPEQTIIRYDTIYNALKKIKFRNKFK